MESESSSIISQEIYNSLSESNISNDIVVNQEFSFLSDKQYNEEDILVKNNCLNCNLCQSKKDNLEKCIKIQNNNNCASCNTELGEIKYLSKEYNEQLLLNVDKQIKLLEIKKKNIDNLFKDLINRINQNYKNFEKKYINNYNNLITLKEKYKNECNKMDDKLKDINSLQNLEHIKDTFDIQKTIINLNNIIENGNEITKLNSSIEIDSFNYNFNYKCEQDYQLLNISYLDNVDFSINIQKQENNIICITVPYCVEGKNEINNITKKTILFPMLINNEFGKFEKTRKLNQNKIFDNHIIKEINQDENEFHISDMEDRLKVSNNNNIGNKEIIIDDDEEYDDDTCFEYKLYIDSNQIKNDQLNFIFHYYSFSN